jgi:DNA invertase Pin-like site-specific DNA recombinase
VLIGYARTSTVDQAAGIEAQRRDLKAARCTKLFEEHTRGPVHAQLRHSIRGSSAIFRP